MFFLDAEHHSHQITVTLIDHDGRETVLRMDKNSNLREELRKAGHCPHGKLSAKANCGGRGLCATCGVWIATRGVRPTHWHDWLAAVFGYPRLACQVKVDRPLRVKLLPNKWLWGEWWPDRPKRRW